VNHVTITRTTIAGALAINVPSCYWATVLPTAALVVSVVTLAGIGVLLGAFTGWAVITGDEPEARVRLELEERLAA